MAIWSWPMRRERSWPGCAARDWRLRLAAVAALLLGAGSASATTGNMETTTCSSSLSPSSFSGATWTAAYAYDSLNRLTNSPLDLWRQRPPCRRHRHWLLVGGQLRHQRRYALPRPRAATCSPTTTRAACPPGRIRRAAPPAPTASSTTAKRPLLRPRRWPVHQRGHHVRWRAQPQADAATALWAQMERN